LADPNELRYYREQASPFSFLYDIVRKNEAELSAAGRRPIMGGLLSKEPVYGTDTVQYEGIGNMLAGLLAPLAKAIDAPYSASQGLISEQDIIPEALGTAGLAMGGGAVLPSPTGALRSGSVRSNPNAQSLFSEDVYHSLRGQPGSDAVLQGDVFDYKLGPVGSGASRLDRLGVHVGTREAAEDRVNTYSGQDLKTSQDRLLNMSLEEANDFKSSATIPLKARMDKPFLNQDGSPFQESEIIEALNNYADQNNFSDLEEALVSFRKDLTDSGFTHVPYVNAIEDRGSISNIMLTDRSAGDPAVLRSRFAAFEDEYSPSIMAANRSGSASLLSSAIAEDLRKANKIDLDPLGYQKTRMRDRRVSDTDVRSTDTGENLSRRPMSWEETEGKVVLPFYGDRTSRGLLVEGVNDVNFDQPVYTEGGVDFMVGPAAQADNSIWASNQNIITRIDKEAAKAAEQFDGADILGLTGSMAPDANDFATMTGAAMAELVKSAKITKKSAKEFDDIMKSIDPDFVGVLSPKIREWAETTTSPKRKSFIRLMDSAPMQAKGFPSPAEARYSVTDPTQRDMPAGMFGLGAARVDTSSPLMFNSPKGNLPRASVPHSTYNTQIAGEYLGSLPPVPQGLLFRDVYDAMEGKVTKSGQPLNEAHKTHAIKTKMPAQKITPEVLEGILSYLSRMEK
jgi:hypothetical protein